MRQGDKLSTSIALDSSCCAWMRVKQLFTPGYTLVVQCAYQLLFKFNTAIQACLVCLGGVSIAVTSFNTIKGHLETGSCDVIH